MPAFQLSAVAAALVSLIRHRTYTPASVAHDGKDHFHEWSEWQPATLKHGQAVTGPRNDPKVWDMVPLYTHPAPAQAPLTREQEIAIKEGERIAASDRYFGARTYMLDTAANRRLFEAGFDAAWGVKLDKEQAR